MKIQMNQFKGDDESLFLEEKINPADLDIDIGIMHFPEELLVEAEASKIGDDLTVNIHVEGDRSFTCSRCLDEFNNLFEKDMTLHYDIKGLETVTIDQDLRDELILDHPIRIVCKEDCLGLCAQCGANLNHEQCRCKVKNN